MNTKTQIKFTVATLAVVMLISPNSAVASHAYTYLREQKIDQPEKILISSHDSCTYYKVTRTGGLYVYDGTEIIDVIPYDYIVRFIELSSSGLWANIYYVDKKDALADGWVRSSYLECYLR